MMQLTLVMKVQRGKRGEGSDLGLQTKCQEGRHVWRVGLRKHAAHSTLAMAYGSKVIRTAPASFIVPAMSSSLGGSTSAANAQNVLEIS